MALEIIIFQNKINRMATLLGLIEKYIFELSFEFQKAELTSRAIVFAHFVVKTVLGVLLIMIVQLKSIKIHPEIVEQIRPYVNFTQKVAQQYLYYISCLLLVLYLIYLGLCLKAIKSKSKSSQTYFEMLNKGTVLLQALGFCSLFVASQVFKYAFVNSVTPLIIINGLTILCVVMLNLYYCLFYISYSLKKKNLFSKLYNRTSLLQCVGKIFLAIWFATMQFDDQVSSIVSLVVVVFILLPRVYSLLFRFEYHSDFTWSIVCITTFFEFDSAFLLLLEDLIGLDLITRNFSMCSVVITLFFYFAAAARKKFRQDELPFETVSQLKNQEDALEYMKIFFGFTVPSKTNEEMLILVSLLKDHCINCKNPSCYCTKNRSKSFDNVANLQADFVNSFVYQKIELLEAQMSKSWKVLMVGGFFKLQAFQNYPKLIALCKKNQHNCSLDQKYAKFSLYRSINDLLQEKNQKHEAIAIQIPLLLEQLLKQIKSKILQTASSMLKKYKYLAKKLCRITELEASSDAQLKIMKQVHFLYKNNIDVYKRSKQFNLIFLFYFQKVFFLLPQLPEIKKGLLESQKKFRINELNDSFSLNKFLFHQEAAILQSVVDQKSMGKLLRVSKNVSKIFGFSQNQLIGANITKIMPQFIRDEHQKVQQEWFLTGRWNNFQKIKEVFILNKNQHLCQCLIYIKIRPSLDSINIVVIVFKKNQSDFIAFDEKNSICALGKKAQSLIGAQSKNLPMNFIFEQTNAVTKTADFQKRSIQTWVKSYSKVSQNLVNQYLDSRMHQEKNTLDKKYKCLFEECQPKQYLAKVYYYYTKMGTMQYLVFEIESIMDKKSQQGQIQYQQQDKTQSNSSYQSETQRNKNRKSDQIGQKVYQQGTSITSANESQNFALSKMISRFTDFFLNPQSIYDSRLVILTVIVFFLFILLIGLVVGVHVFYNLGLTSLSQIMFADGAVSDNMQLLQFMYNNLMMMQQFQGKPELRASTNQSGVILQNYLYGLMALDLQYLFKNVTKLGGMPYYDYLRENQTWYFPKATRLVEIDSNQFMQFYVHAAIMGLFFDREKESSRMILENFPEMKRINHQNIYKYLDMSLFSLQMLYYCYYLAIGSFAAITIFLAIFLHMFFYFRFTQSNKCFEAFHYINQNQLQSLTSYYAGIIQYMSIMNDNFESSNSENIFLSFSTNENTVGSTSKLNLVKNKRYLSFIWILILLASLNTFNIIINIQIQRVFKPSEDMTLAVNYLMDSENFLLQAYFDLKAYHLVHDRDYDLIPFIDSILLFVQQDEVLFNKIAADSIKLFSAFDPSYEKDFINLLVDDICTMVQGVLGEFEVQKCKNEFYLNMINIGVISGMNFYQRELATALYEFKNNDQATKDPDSFFLQKRFQDMDDSIIYMFKMYQSTQQRILKSLNRVIFERMNFSLFCILLQTIIFISLLGAWTFLIGRHKRQLAQIYGYFLLIPPQMIKQNKNIVRQVEQNLDIRNT